MIQNRYLVVHLIGKGGMGEVYLAVDQRLGSAVALKRTYFQDDAALGTAFEREARILARLRHPVLPKVIDHFSENGDQFLVMEHIAGDDLGKRLENANKPFPLSWVMFWADQMLDALNYLHSHEPPIVHRDIKPQNLKLTDDNHIVLLDFGLSKDFDTQSGKNSLNSASVAGYSPHFASMEQIRGTGTDARSDIFSLSATLYQLMTNTTPLDVLSRADAMLGGTGDPITPLNELNPEIPASISKVILKGVSVRQDERFSTAVEMQKALRRAFNSSTSEARTVEYDAAQPEPTADSTRTKLTEMLPTLPTPANEPELKPNPLAAIPATIELNQAAVATQILSAESIDNHGAEPPMTRVIAADAAANSAPPTVAFRMPPEVEKKASGKAGVMIGVAAGVFLLLAVAGVGGWFAYSSLSAKSVPSPTPSPTPAMAALPSPAATEEVAEQIEEEDPDPVRNFPPDNNSNRVAEIPRDPNAPVTTTRPPTATKNPPPRAGQPPPKAQPKPKPRDDRTVILQ